MIKQWNLAHSEFLSSYHIEVLSLNAFTGNLDDTPWHVFQFFEKARTLLEKSLWHELGFADDYLSYSDRIEALKRFDIAIAKSRDAKIEEAHLIVEAADTSTMAAILRHNIAILEGR